MAARRAVLWEPQFGEPTTERVDDARPASPQKLRGRENLDDVRISARRAELQRAVTDLIVGGGAGAVKRQQAARPRTANGGRRPQSAGAR